MSEIEIKARGTFGGQELEDILVLNAGGWFGKTWLLEIGGSYWPLLLVVEADSVSDAIDELADHEKYGFHIVVPPEDLGDYPEGERHSLLRTSHGCWSDGELAVRAAAWSSL